MLSAPLLVGRISKQLPGPLRLPDLIVEPLCQACFMLWRGNGAGSEGQPLIKNQRGWVDELHLFSTGWEGQPFSHRPVIKTHFILLLNYSLCFCQHLMPFSMQKKGIVRVCMCDQAYMLHHEEAWGLTHSRKHVDLFVSLISRIQSPRLDSQPAVISFEPWREYKCSSKSPQPRLHCHRT